MLHKFKINITIRVTTIILLSAGIMVSLYYGFYLTTAFVTVLLIITVANMVHYVNQTNRDLANFFESVKYNDFVTNTSARHKGESFGELHSGLNLINSKFRDIRAEKEANHQFLQTIVEHIDIGLLCVNMKDEVVLMNKALQELLHKSYLTGINGLKKIDENLWKTVRDIKPGTRELVKLNVQNKLLQLSIQAVDITLQREPFRLISFQNIQNELEAQELMAWQKLIRILTHEIMNSVAPITSLSSTIHQMLNQNGQSVTSHIDKVKQSIEVIQKRSEGLLDFTETYRSLTRIPPPKFQVVDAKDLLEEVYTLMEPDLERHKVRFERHFPPSKVAFHGDPHLLEQVLINLVKNAIDAVKDRPDPKIIASTNAAGKGKILMQIIDNGVGISEEVMEQIFVPFYTTKEEGSGIGLSLSRQIIRMHKGNLELQSAPGEGTTVTIRV